jgi:hypothetical protein
LGEHRRQDGPARNTRGGTVGVADVPCLPFSSVPRYWPLGPVSFGPVLPPVGRRPRLDS